MIMKDRIVRAVLAVTVFLVGCGAAFAQSWSFANNLLTGSDGMVLNASLSGTEVKVTGVSKANGLTTIDLRGQVTGPNGESYTIVEATINNITGLKELYLPDTIRTLSGVAGITTLEKVEPFLPASMTSVPSFKQCSKLTGDLKLSNPKITSIPTQYFRETAITSVDLGECPITSIGSSAFVSCKSLKTVTPFLPSTVSFIGEYAFSGCSALTGDLCLDNASLKETGKSSFASTKITSVDFGNSPIETIENSFNSCGSVTNITPFLPPTVKSLGTGQYGFGNKSGYPACQVAKVLHLNSPDLTSIPWGCFMNMPITGLDLTGSAVSSIVGHAFDGCKSLKTVEPFLPATVTTLGEGAFSGCPVTNDLTMACETSGEIGKSVFGGTKPPYISLHEANLTSIGDNAFLNCGAKKVTLPASLKSIGMKGFNGNSFSEGCWFYGPKPSFGSYVFTPSGAACTGAFFFPKGDLTWETYLADPTKNTVSDLTDAQKEKFKTMFPSVRRVPKKKVQIEKNGSAQYLCWWYPVPPGMTVIVR